MRMNLTQNFLARNLPEAVPELLSLLGLYSHWDATHREHVIWQKGEVNPPIYRWTSQVFKGGSQEQWSAFLAKVTSSGWKTMALS